MSDNPDTPVIKPLVDITADAIATPEDIFKLTQTERLATVNLMRHLEGADVKAGKLKLTALKDMADQEIARKRLAVDEEGMKSEKEIAQHIAELSRAISTGANGNPFLRKVTGGVPEKPEKVNRPDIHIEATTMNASPIKVTSEQFLSENLKE